MSRFKADRSVESSDTRSLGNRLPRHATVRLWAVPFVTVLSFFIAVPSNAGPPIPDPDLRAWELLVALAAPTSNGSNDALFETFPTDQDTFPLAPNPDVCPDPGLPALTCGFLRPTPQECIDAPQDHIECTCPCDPGPEHRPEVLTAIAQNPLATCDFDMPGPCEVVYRNATMFDYMLENDLWYTEGAVKALFGPDPIPEGISFPMPDSIALKAEYIEMDPCDSARFHCNVVTNLTGICNLSNVPCEQDSDCPMSPKICLTIEREVQVALVALHIMARVVPNWLWVTFEHKDNPGQCDYIGCHDSFGLEGGVVPPHEGCGPTLSACPSDCPSDPIQCAISCAPCGERYVSALTPAAIALLEANGLPQAWENYRLKGTQHEFVDSVGEPTHLGNSVTESTFVPTSSCITCHSRATLSNQNPTTALNIFNCQCSSTPSGCNDPKTCGCAGNGGFLGDFQSSWLMDGEFIQTEFSWAIAFKANSIVPPHNPVNPVPSFGALPQCPVIPDDTEAEAGACCDGATGDCDEAVAESQCECPDCEWTVDAACDDVVCEGPPPPPQPQACIFGQIGLFAIPMMLVAMGWMRLNRNRRVTRQS